MVVVIMAAGDLGVDLKRRAWVMQGRAWAVQRGDRRVGPDGMARQVLLRREAALSLSSRTM